MHPAHRFQQVLLVSSAVAADFGSAGAYTGEGTTYGLTDPSGGNCNFMDYPQAAVSNFVAINKVQWDDSMSCGRCAQVTCTDPQCAGRSKQSEIVYVVDQCPGCNDGDLDLSPTVFKAITGMEPSRVEISWEFVTCPVSGKIKYCLKEGSNAFWAAIQPTHTVVGVDSVTIDGKPTSMVASSFYFLLDGDSTEKSDLSNLKITMTSVSGETIEDVLSFADGDCVEGKSQFTKGESASVSVSTLSESATVASTEAPTESPTSATTTEPPTTEPPTMNVPTEAPTVAPTRAPTAAPPTVSVPTEVLTDAPTTAPPTTNSPTEAPTMTEAPTTAPTETSSLLTDSPTSVPSSNLEAATTAPSTTTPPSDNTESAGISVTNRSSDAGAGPTIVVSVLAVLGCLFILVILVMYFVVKKKKQLNEQLEREKHHDGSRCSAESDYHTNVAIDEQLPFPYTAAATPQPPCSPSI
ncbi:hypothetical protein PC121_g18783 [Phytophthora cactorum]|nr:hypothetical protein PC120_g17885 [Phytophthora cactorum]KAG3049716.1 hypothetical protein PC121_g18783 [Phytophthora cactorum]KAG4046314.1 hypothetical protein PC123_g18301 [Phytophthora cactorum]